MSERRTNVGTKLCPSCKEIITSARREYCTRCTPPTELDLLRAKCAWQADLLQRAKEYLGHYVDCELAGFEGAEALLADYEKGPTDE